MSCFHFENNNDSLFFNGIIQFIEKSNVCKKFELIYVFKIGIKFLNLI
jgi:hypothetical protein